MKTHKIRTNLLAIVGAVAVLTSQSARGEELFHFEFDEGSGGTVANTAGTLSGYLGTQQVDPETDTVAVETDSPSGAPGDGSFSNLGNGFLIANDPTRVLDITNGPITMEAWVKINGAFAKPNEGIMSYGNSYKMGLKSGRLVFTLLGQRDVTNAAAGGIPADQWVHLAAAWTPGVGVDFYVNGSHNFVALTNLQSRPISHTYLSLGSEGLNNALIGSYDRMRIHNAVLTPEHLDSNAATVAPTLASTIISYNFNEGSFPATNSLLPELPAESASELLTTLTGRPFWTEGVTGLSGDTALQFFGTNRVTIADPTPLIVTNALNGDYTLEAWAKIPVDYAPSPRAIMFQYTGIPGFAFSINNNRTLHTTAFGKIDRTSTALVPNDGEWHHLAVVHRTGVAFEFYIDGALIETIAYTAGVGVNQTAKTITIGMAATGANPFTGTLDRIRFSNAALTPSELDFPETAGAPFFGAQPDDQTVVITSSATFSATAYGIEPLTYQWQFSATGEPGTWTALNGETTDTLELVNIQPADAGFYSLILQNPSGVITSRLAQLTVTTAPVIETQPSDLARVVGESASLTVVATPAPGFEDVTYQWRYGTDPDSKSDIPGANQPTLQLNNLQLTNQGFYSVVISNSGGITESDTVKLTVTASGTLKPLWQILPGERPYITEYNAGASLRDLERGMAYNPVTDHLLIAARWTSPNVKGIYIIDADTGAHIGELNGVSNIVTGGTIVLTRIDISDDGAIYACNFGTLSDANPLKIYRWANETAEPTIAYQGNPVSGTGLPNQQWGKNMTIRGAGANTQILMDTRNFLAVFTTEDGETFSPSLILPEGQPDDWNRSLVWGEDGTNFWGNANGRPLYQWAFEPGTTNAPLLRTYPGTPGDTIEQVSFDETYQYFAGLTIQSGPDQVELYDMSDLDRGPVLVDAVPFASDNPQTVGYGNVLISRNRVFALNPNNGVLALTFAPQLSIRKEGANTIVSWPKTLPDYGNYMLKVADTVLLTDAETVVHAEGTDSYEATITAGETQRFFFLTRE